MYNKEKKIVSSEEINIEPYIENTDIYNSKFLYILTKLPYVAEYEVDLSEYRIDLISKDIYDTELMSEIILLYNGVTIKELKRGVVLKVPYILDVRNLLKNISSIDSPSEYLKELLKRNS